MWVLSSYSHPTLVLSTNWYDKHETNLYATIPPNNNGDYVFVKNGFKDLSPDEIYEKIISKGVSKAGLVDKILSIKI